MIWMLWCRVTGRQRSASVRVLFLLGALSLAAACDDYRSGAGSASQAGAGGLPAGAGSSPIDLGASSGRASAGAEQSGGSSSGGSSGAAGLPASVHCDEPSPVEPSVVSAEPSPSDEDFLNPERGFHANAPLPSAALDDFRAEGSSLVRSYVVLKDFRTQTLSQDFLDQLSYSLELVRDRGLKVVLRFAYNDDGSADAPLSTVMQHIAQLKPVVQANADIIAVLQAGFIGQWGEWHDSENGLNTPENRQTILDGLLDMLPASRQIQLRYPWQRKQIFPDLLTDATAFSGTGAARVGHHNDCFLTSDNDLGTYGDFVNDGLGSAPDDQVMRWMQYVQSESRFTATGAETCENTDRSSCAHALNELARFHYSYLNSDYFPEVNARWVSEGCMPEVRRRLGYRLELTHVSFNDVVRPGGVLRLALTLENRGFAAPYNERPVYLVLDGPAHVLAPLSIDPRRLLPENGPFSFSALLRVPATLAAGQYRVALWLPDASERLQGRPEYAIRLANSGVWQDGSGDNTLGELSVDANAPGCVDSAASQFSELTP